MSEQRALLLDGEDRLDGPVVRLIKDDDAGEAAPVAGAPSAVVSGGEMAPPVVATAGASSAAPAPNPASVPAGPAAPVFAAPAPAPTAKAPVVMVPGLGKPLGATTGAMAGFVHGLAANISAPNHLSAAALPFDSNFSEPGAMAMPSGPVPPPALVQQAQQEPHRFGPDLVIHQHDPLLWRSLSDRGGLHSDVWGRLAASRQLSSALERANRDRGEELAEAYGDRPFAERAMLGLAAATGTDRHLAAALDGVRHQRAYPAPAGFGAFVRDLTEAEVAHVGAQFLQGVEPAVEAYRAARRAAEIRLSQRRLPILRILIREWPTGAPTVVPLFERLTRYWSPAQVDRMRRALRERREEASQLFAEIEEQNALARVEEATAAFRRWAHTWRHYSHAQTPLQEEVVVAPARAPARRRPRVVEDVVDARPEEEILLESGPRTPRPRPQAVVAEPRPDEVVVEPAEREDAVVQVRQEAPALPAPPERVVLPETTVAVERPDEDDDRDADDEPRRRVPEPFVRVPPGAAAADGVVPLVPLMQGFLPADIRRIRRGWDDGRAWDVYRDRLRERAEERCEERERAFLDRLAEAGCAADDDDCHLDRRVLRRFADLGRELAPDQWDRLEGALCRGEEAPLVAWRAVERENLREAMESREPQFMRHVGAWRGCEFPNPVEFAEKAPALASFCVGKLPTEEAEAAGLLDDLGGAVSSAVSGATGGGGGSGGGGLGDLMQKAEGALGGLGGGGGGGASSGGGLGDLVQKAAGALPGNLGSFAEKAAGALTGGGDLGDLARRRRACSAASPAVVRPAGAARAAGAAHRAEPSATSCRRRRARSAGLLAVGRAPGPRRTSRTAPPRCSRRRSSAWRRSGSRPRSVSTSARSCNADSRRSGSRGWPACSPSSSRSSSRVARRSGATPATGGGAS